MLHCCFGFQVQTGYWDAGQLRTLAFIGLSKSSCLSALRNDESMLRPAFAEKMTSQIGVYPGAVALIKRCLMCDPASRPTMQQVLLDPYWCWQGGEQLPAAELQACGGPLPTTVQQIKEWFRGRGSEPAQLLD